MFYSFQDGNANRSTGIIAVASERLDARMARPLDEVVFVESELDILNQTIDCVLQLDPDIVTGWEVQAASWGYLEARGRTFGACGMKILEDTDSDLVTVKEWTWPMQYVVHLCGRWGAGQTNGECDTHQRLKSSDGTF